VKFGKLLLFVNAWKSPAAAEEVAAFSAGSAVQQHTIALPL
jgi:hypothetical protein